MTRVYLVRHADVENPQRVLYGHLPGFPLSERGRSQAVEVGKRLHDRGISRILHSPLERAVETARLIAEQLPEPVTVIPEPALLEAEIGKYLQGVPYWQIPVRRPLWLVHKARRGLLPGDEALDQMGGRVVGVMHRVAREHPDEASVLVASNRWKSPLDEQVRGARSLERPANVITEVNDFFDTLHGYVIEHSF